MKILIGAGNLILDERGCILDILTEENKSIYPKTEDAPFIQVGINGILYSPTKMEIEDEILKFVFFINENKDIEVDIRIKTVNKYTTFSVVNICECIEYIVFGPIPNTIGEIIGDVIGVSRDDNYALGIQALNIKTLSGFPPYKKLAYEKYGSDDIMSDTSVGSYDYFRCAAFATEFGSVLQLYCENRTMERIRTVENIENAKVLPFEDEDAKIEGASFALFCCKSEETLETIGKIEVDENLPHPTIDGQWAKTSRQAMRSYFITEFGVDNIDKMIEFTKKGGFKELYHSEPFETWGNFKLASKWFPHGDNDLKECGIKAKENGLGLGIHTLTNFTTTNDKYVTPVPSKNLAKIGWEILIEEIGLDDEEIKVSNMDIFTNQSFLRTVQIDDELIQFSNVTEGENILENCVRGAFGTKKASHDANSRVYMLFDHGYKVFLADINLQDEYCNRLIELFKKCNLVQISFDGLEGCLFSGEGPYAENRFCSKCNDGWEYEVINDASRLNHNLWHMHTRMNWGEPWGEKMRAGMIDKRIGNQEYYKKNLFPRMLGWFLIRSADRKFEATSLDDIEWALSKAAGFDAGFAVYSVEKTLDKLGTINDILESIKMWEKLRLENAFPDEIKEELKSQDTEWHLEKKEEDNESEFLLFPTDMSQEFTCDLNQMQPGQRGGADWSCNNKFQTQEYGVKMRVLGEGQIENPALTTKEGTIQMLGIVKADQYLIYKGNGEAIITDKNYNVIDRIKVIGKGVLLNGQQALSFYCDHEEDEDTEVVVSIETKGRPYEISL